jgi:hypothetical protein
VHGVQVAKEGNRRVGGMDTGELDQCVLGESFRSARSAAAAAVAVAAAGGTAENVSRAHVKFVRKVTAVLRLMCGPHAITAWCDQSKFTQQ